MKRDCLRKYIDAVEVRISVLDRILSGALTDADFIQRIAPDLATGGLNGLYNDMCNELADNLCCMPIDNKREIANYYFGKLQPLMVGYDDKMAELADRVRDMGISDAVEDIKKIAEAVNDNTIRLGDLDSLIERYYTPKGLPTIRDTDNERQVFERAIRHGYMVREGNGYKWQRKPVMLAYLIIHLYWRINGYRVPERAVHDLFGVQRIGNHIRRMLDAKKTQKWQETMDRDLFSDDD